MTDPTPAQPHTPTQKPPGRLYVLGGFLFWAVVIGLGVSYCAADDTQALQSQSERSPASIVYKGPVGLKPSALLAVQALYEACPAVDSVSRSAGTVSVSASQAAPFRTRDYGWSTEVWVEMDLPADVIHGFPELYRQPWIGNHLNFVLGGGRRPGAEVRWPTTMWLCHLDVDDAVLAPGARWPDTNHIVPIPNLKQLLR